MLGRDGTKGQSSNTKQKEEMFFLLDSIWLSLFTKILSGKLIFSFESHSPSSLMLLRKVSICYISIQTKMLDILLWVSMYDTDQPSHLTAAALQLNFSSTSLLSASPESPVSRFVWWRTTILYPEFQLFQWNGFYKVGNIHYWLMRNTLRQGLGNCRYRTFYHIVVLC